MKFLVILFFVAASTGLTVDIETEEFVGAPTATTGPTSTTTPLPTHSPLPSSPPVLPTLAPSIRPGCDLKYAESWFPTSNELASLEQYDTWKWIKAPTPPAVWTYSTSGRILHALINPPVGVSEDFYRGTIVYCPNTNTSIVRLEFFLDVPFNIQLIHANANRLPFSRTLFINVDHAGSCGPKKSTWELLSEGSQNIHPNNQITGLDVQTAQANDAIIKRFAKVLGATIFATKINDNIKAVNDAFTANGSAVIARFIGHGHDGRHDSSSSESIQGNFANTRKLGTGIRGKVSYVQLFGCCVANGADEENHVLQSLANAAATSKQAVTVGGYNRVVNVGAWFDTISTPSDTQYLAKTSEAKVESCTCEMGNASNRYPTSECKANWTFYSLTDALKAKFPGKTFGEVCQAIKNNAAALVWPKPYYKEGVNCKQSGGDQYLMMKSCEYQP